MDKKLLQVSANGGTWSHIVTWAFGFYANKLDATTQEMTANIPDIGIGPAAKLQAGETLLGGMERECIEELGSFRILRMMPQKSSRTMVFLNTLTGLYCLSSLYLLNPSTDNEAHPDYAL
jgi:hypothetical protein